MARKQCSDPGSDAEAPLGKDQDFLRPPVQGLVQELP